MSDIIISPSVLSADFSMLGKEVEGLEKAGADWVHIDVMDGHFVPNITFGAPVVKSIKNCTRLPLDVHLMIENPQAFIDDFVDAGADIITVHSEADVHMDRCLQKIHDAGVKAGISLVPSTPLSALRYILHRVDLVLLMTVNPGFGGQSFIPQMLGKIAELRQMLDEHASESGRAVHLQVDGGVNLNTIGNAVSAGADNIVAGSAIFGSGGQPWEEYARRILQMQKMVQR